MGFISSWFGGKPRPPSPDFELVPSRTEEGSGFIVRRIADGKHLRWQSLPKRQGLESMAVVGVSFRPDALQDPSFAPGRPLALVPEPENPHDPNAIAVWNAARTIHVGYLPRDEAAKIAKALGDGPRLGSLVIWETRAEGSRVAIRALLVGEQARLRGVNFK